MRHSCSHPSATVTIALGGAPQEAQIGTPRCMAAGIPPAGSAWREHVGRATHWRREPTAWMRGRCPPLGRFLTGIPQRDNTFLIQAGVFVHKWRPRIATNNRIPTSAKWVFRYSLVAKGNVGAPARVLEFQNTLQTGQVLLRLQKRKIRVNS